MSENTFIKKLERGIRQVEDALVIFCGVIFLGMMFLGTADVLGRYLIDKPIMGTQEISTMIMGAIVLLGWAYTLKEGEHVSVTLFYNMFPARVQPYLTIITLTLSLILFAVITWQSWDLAVTKLMEGRRSIIIEMPTGPFYFMVPVGGFFMCVELIVNIAQKISRLRKA